MFLAAAARLGVSAADCVAFEDAPIGVMAARDAGMTTVAVGSSFPADVFLAPEVGADVVVRDFDGVTSAGPGAILARRRTQFSILNSQSHSQPPLLGRHGDRRRRSRRRCVPRAFLALPHAHANRSVIFASRMPSKYE